MEGANCVLVRLSPEITLKSHFVRAYFVNKLISNIKGVLRAKNLSGNSFVKGGGRLYVFPRDKKRVGPLALVLKNVFGVQGVAECKKVSSVSRSEIMDAALSVAVKHLKSGDSFAVRLKNSLEKSFSSREFESSLGSKIISSVKGLKVNLKNPQKQVSIEVGAKGCFLYVGELQGVCGLPLGVEGNVAVFFEGKKSELLAAFLMMRRGCNVFPVLKKNTIALREHVNHLVKWNSFRAFKFSTEKDLEGLVQKKDVSIKAIVKSDGEFGLGMEKQKNFFSVPVFWPLVFLPKEFEQKFLAEL